MIGAYIFVGPRTESERRQIDAVMKAGAARRRIWIDRAPDRAQRDRIVAGGLGAGDILVVPTPETIGSGVRDRTRVLKALAANGVQIQVGEDPPDLIDTQDKIKAFLAAALANSRAANGKALGKKHATGRPTKWAVTEADKAVICPLWYDKSVPVDQVLEKASALVGKPVERHHVKYWCGALRVAPKDN